MTLIRDTLPPPRRVAVSVVASPLTDLLVALWSKTAERDNLDSFEHSDDINAIHTAVKLSDDDAEWMGEAGGNRWTFMLEFIVDDSLQTIDELVETLSRIDAEDLFTSVHHDLNNCGDDCCDHLDIADPQADKDRILGILSSIPSEVRVSLKGSQASLEHDRMLTEFLAKRLETESLIESVTNGIAFRIEPSVDRVVLLPSLVIRPWNLLFKFDSARYFVYSASDEATQADADSPPMWMIELFKSLGDESRLRLLRKLGDGPASLTELAEFVELAKSTTHHHLRVLRAAGLVKAVISGPGKDGTHYEFRPGALADASHFVTEYLKTEPLGVPDDTSR